jgi:hypothetical protein
LELTLSSQLEVWERVTIAVRIMARTPFVFNSRRLSKNLRNPVSPKRKIPFEMSFESTGSVESQHSDKVQGVWLWDQARLIRRQQFGSEGTSRSICEPSSSGTTVER